LFIMSLSQAAPSRHGVHCEERKIGRSNANARHSKHYAASQALVRKREAQGAE
jgi:hypothetical protein